MNEKELINKFRPSSFEEVLGNELVVTALKSAAISSTCPHSFLFSSEEPGVGKTTLARIVAGAVKASVQETSGATQGGVDDARNLVEMASFKPVLVSDSTPNIMFIIDECHAASSAYWQALLKLTEEPPKWAYFSLCTTKIDKIPQTIQTRCFPVRLRKLSTPNIEDLVTLICDVEGWKVTDSTFAAIVLAADGSARRAISILQAGHACKDREELAQIVAKVDSDESPIAEICQLVIDGNRSWPRIAALLAKIEDQDEAYHHAQRYILSRMLKSDAAKAKICWDLLERLVASRTTFDGKVLLSAGIGSLFFG
jgi:DNA polymerase-3 subunit gamma/tau